MRRFVKSLFGRTPATVRNAPAAKTRLGVTALEDRNMPAILSAGAIIIEGTAGSDVVNVDDYTATFTFQGFTSTASFVSVTENGQTQNFPRTQLTADLIVFQGNDGNDRFDNDDTTLRVIADGGVGNDVLDGSNQADELTGGIGDDTLLGAGGDDELSGSSGNDVLEGSSGNDDLNGSTGNDRLYGGSGDDELSGSSGDDYLSGGSGVDDLSGGSGRDGLLGGVGDGDSVTGGSGQDRFLDWTNTIFGDGETRTDVAAEDAVVFFRNDGAQLVLLGSNMGWTEYSAGSWSESQIESVDKGLATLQNQTGNTRLLKTSGGGSLTFHKAGSADGDPAGGWNSGGGSITLTNAGAVSDANLQRVAIHEVAHNWDEESPFYTGWLALSGWERNIPLWHDAFPPTGKVKSGDGGWWHSSNAQFARNYGKMNPLEDFATSWEAFFGLNGTQVTAKMTHLQAFFDYITALG
jgi:Ca2+-binding RTX toxin-like protein